MNERDMQHQENLERIKKLRLLDDELMTKCFENNVAGTKLLLDLILPVKLRVHRVTTQAFIKNLQGRSLRLDILAEDEVTHDQANVEIQREGTGAGAKRARYHGSIMDANYLLVGEDFEKLPENFVVFITETDVFHKGLPLYIFDRYCLTDNGALAFGDKLHIIYVNSEIQDNTPLGLLMHDFHCSNPDDMYYKILADRVRYFKENEKGMVAMSGVMDELRKETALLECKKFAMRMLMEGELTHEKIAKYTGLPLEQVKELAREKSA